MVSDAYHEHVRELLASVPELGFRRMFGGLGVFSGGRMFALAAADQLYLKTDAQNRAAFEAAGSEPFAFTAKGRVTATSYWRLPPGAEDDAGEADPWIALALDATHRAVRPRKGKTAHDLGPGPWDE